MNRQKVLFVCEHNSARSLMAEAFLRQLGGDAVEVESAGLDPAPLNPLAVEVMAEVGLDISGKKPQSVFALYRQGRLYTHVITVCNQTAAKCPVFPGLTRRLDWPFDDPAGFTGSREAKLSQARELREAIRRRIVQWLDEARTAK